MSTYTNNLDTQMKNTRNVIMMSVFNRLNLTKKTIEHNMDYAGVPFELWITDDGSEEDTKEYIKNLKASGWCKKIRYVLYSESLGKAKRLNEFLLEKNYDYCATIDNDVILPVNWFKKCINALQEESFGMCGVNVEGLSGRVIIQDIPNQNVFFTNCIGGACLVWGSFVRDNITTFCEDYGRYGHEDAHITYEVRVRGKHVVCLKDFGIHLDCLYENNDEDSDWQKWYKDRKEEDFNKGLSKLQENIKKINIK